MRVATIAVLAALCAACTSKIEKAEQEFAIVKQAHAGPIEVCARGKAVADAYLEAGDGQVYEQKKVEADIDCETAKMDEQAMVPDDMDALSDNSHSVR